MRHNKVDKFSIFSFKILEQVNLSTSKIIMNKQYKILLPFLIINDPFLFIETEVFWEQSFNYNFQLFEIYHNINN